MTFQDLLYKVRLYESSLPPNYPKISSPVTNKDLKTIFDFFVDRYYGSGFIGNVRLKFSPLAKNFYGKAHCKMDGDYIIKDLLITVSSKIKNDPKAVIDTIGHEIIHIWQYRMNEKEKTLKYSEPTWGELFKSNDKHTYGHNKYFIDEMNKMNKDGFDIAIDMDAPLGVELTTEVYGVVFYEDGASPILLWHKSNPTKYIDKIIDDIIGRVGTTYNKYCVFKTLESNITLATRLTKNYLLPKNVINIQFKSEFVDDIMNSNLTTIISTEDIEFKKDTIENNITPDVVQPEIVKTISITNKFRNQSWDNYFPTVYFNAFPSWTRIKSSELFSKGYEFKGEKMPDDLTFESAQYIYDNWLKITDSELKRSNAFKYFFTDFKMMILRKKVDERAVEKLLEKYTNNFSMRVKKGKFVNLLKDFLFSSFNKEAKKKSKPFLERDEFEETFNSLFKDTWLTKLN